MRVIGIEPTTFSLGLLTFYHRINARKSFRYTDLGCRRYSIKD